ncbi:MAG: repressor LexA [Clostridia bacterium]|nr:repressor LexA [Clostridia bacterium]
MTLNKLSKLFNVSIDYLLGRETINNEEIINIEGIKPISTIKIPLLGKIACGKPIFAEEDKESYVLAGTNIQADFCLIASGDSMINARILNGDIVFIRKQEMVTNGEIAAVLIGNEVTLKRIFYYPEKSKLVLQAENPLYEPLVYINEELNEIKILGKAVAFQSDVK